MKIGIGNDHAAVDMKNDIVKFLQEKGIEVVNYGTDTYDSCNYPEYGEKVGRAVAAGEVDCGVLICGTGVGISIGFFVVFSTITPSICQHEGKPCSNLRTYQRIS